MSCVLSLLNNKVHRGVSTSSTLIPIGMGVANPKFSKRYKKLKRTKHCTIPKTLTRKDKKMPEKGTGLMNMRVVIKEATKIQKDAHKPSLGELLKFTLVENGGMNEERY